ncbi:MAG: preprotein translocase subunit YajC, partial [Megasphaera elsdenii]|nr:preprotein translocase subunit YajC [Megasphaera elsdenii]
MDIMEQLNAFWPIILMVVIFYFLLWRPQKIQQKKRQEMLESLKPG